MAQFSRIEVVQQMKELGMVPLFYHHDIEVAKAVLKACFSPTRQTISFPRVMPVYNNFLVNICI